MRLDSSLFQEEVPGVPIGHIHELTATDLAAILRSVMIQPEISFLSYWVLRREPRASSAFPHDDADLLAPHLQVALGKARANEIAVFFLRKTREDGIPIVTTGGVLIHGDHFVVLLANARRPTTTQRKLDSVREAPLASLGDPDFHIVPGPYQLSLPTKDLPKHIAMTSIPALLVDYRALLAGFLPSGQSSSLFHTEPVVPAALIEEKLHRLRTWREQGLITEDEYRDKRQELLKQF